MKGTIKTLILFLILHLSIGAIAQEQDFQTRIGIDASGDLSGDFAWSGKVQQRWRYNSSLADRSLLQGGLNYSPLSFLKVGVGYRGTFIYDPLETTVYKQRVHADLLLDHRIDRVKIVYRSRYQYGLDDTQTFSQQTQASTWRHRIALKYYPFGWALRPQVSVELFHKLNTTDERALQGVRYALGVDYLLTQDLALSLEYLLNKELNVANPLSEHILSLGISYAF